MLHTLRRARLHAQATPSLDALLKAHIGLHSTDYATPYLSALARVPGFDPARLFQRLQSGDGLLRMNAFRNTVHVVHANDAGLVCAATGAAIEKVGRRIPSLKALGDAAIDRGVARICDALQAGPQPNNALKAAVPDLPDLRYWLYVAMGRGLVVRADTPHARSNRTRYALASQWLPFERPDPVDARRELLLRAVQAFGPVTVDDLSWWLPAPKREVLQVLAQAGPDYESVASDGVAHWFHKGLLDTDTSEPLGAWLLPYEDSLLKGYRDRNWLLAPGLRDVLFPFSIAHWAPPDGVAPGPGPHKGVNTTGEARPSIWWQGRAVGRWEEQDGVLRTQVHADIGHEGLQAVAAAAERVESAWREQLQPLFSAPAA